MIFTLAIISLYSIIDDFYEYIHAQIESYVGTHHYSNYMNETLLSDNTHVYFCIKTINIFSFYIFILIVSKQIYSWNSSYIRSFALPIVYTQYIIKNVLRKEVSLYEYESNRNVMWIFATIPMLDMYCYANKRTLLDISAVYHILPIIVNSIIHPLKYAADVNMKYLYYTVKCMSCMSICRFIYTLYVYHSHLLFTNMIIFIWSIFTVISMIEIGNLVDIQYLQVFYLCSDVLSKTLINVVVHDHIERQTQLKQNTDLQSIQFISCMLNHIRSYRTDNVAISKQCEHVIEMVKQVFTSHIPDNENLLKMELLSKLLPFGLEQQVINMGKVETKQNDEQRYENICILFTDVVNYAELASKLDSNTIFRILDNMYRCFDGIIRKYKFLQKIETIGDAYMVVGDINRTNSLEYKHVVESMLELALELLKEIQNIKTPSGDELHIRIGMHIGGVSIGVLGTEIPRLCIVGNTVNIASRLQSTCPVDSIHFSREIKTFLHGYTVKNMRFISEKHERTFLKHIGTMTTYSLKPIFDGNPDKLTNESSTYTLDETSHGEYSKENSKINEI